MAHHILGQSRSQTTLFSEVLDECVSDSLYTIDGSKFKAVNNKSKNYTPSKVQFHIDCAEKSIQKYLSQIDTKDDNEKHPKKAPHF